MSSSPLPLKRKYKYTFEVYFQKTDLEAFFCYFISFFKIKQYFFEKIIIQDNISRDHDGPPYWNGSRFLQILYFL